MRFLGAVFLSILVLLGALAAAYIPKGLAMQKQASAYFESNLPLIVENWNSEEVTKRAAPEFLVPDVREGLPIAFAQLSKLGKLRHLGRPKGGVVAADFQLAFTENRLRLAINNQQVKPVWAEFAADAEFEGGPATVKMTLVHRGGGWHIMGFWVGPPSSANGDQ